MAGRAQLSQQRSRDRREALLDAAIELFAEDGTRSVTHRAVAARAGLPSASTVYYFESIDQLVRAALERHVRQWIATMRGLADADPEFLRGLVADVDRAGELVAGVFGVRGPEEAGLEVRIYLAAARDPELRQAAADALAAFEDVACGLLAGAGVPDPEPLAASLVAQVAGVALRRQSGRYTDEQEARLLARAVRDLVAAYVR